MMTNPDTLHAEKEAALTEREAVEVAIRYIKWWEAGHGRISNTERLTSMENLRQAWRVRQMFKDGPPLPEPYDPHIATAADFDKEAKALIAIRSRQTVQVGMPVPVLMKIVIDSKKFTKGERAAIADRCFTNVPIDKVTCHKLRGIMTDAQWQLVVERLRL